MGEDSGIYFNGVERVSDEEHPTATVIYCEKVFDETIATVKCSVCKSRVSTGRDGFVGFCKCGFAWGVHVIAYRGYDLEVKRG